MITYMEKMEIRPFMHTNQLKRIKDLNIENYNITRKKLRDIS